MATKLTHGIGVIKTTAATLPLKPGVYRMLSAAGDVLYVGKAKQLKKRVTSYTQPARLPLRLQRMVAETAAMEIVVTHTEAEALLLEANLIKKLLPKYNISLRDDKMFPYVALGKNQEFPQLYKFRGVPNKKQQEVFGPFANAGALHRTLVDLQKIFKLRTCADTIFTTRQRPCLQYHIKRCTAPCVGLVSTADYAQQVAEARAFLTGKSRALQQDYTAAMHTASSAQNYEQAAVYRDRIKLLTQLQATQDINLPGVDDADIFGVAQQGGQVCVQAIFFRQGRNYGTRAFFPKHDDTASMAEVLSAFITQFYLHHQPPATILLNVKPTEAALIQTALHVTLTIPQRGEKKRVVDFAVSNAAEALARRFAARDTQAGLLQELASRLGLPDVPERIEIYDNSHISGSNAVGAMVVAGADGWQKNAYRKFNIRTKQHVSGGDDFSMMREVLQRRFAKTDSSAPDWPDLVILDGGLGQLNVALEVLAELGINTSFGSGDLNIIAIAKGPDRDAGREDIYLPARAPFKLPPTDPVLYYLQRLRDEAHRFAIGSHRTRRTADIRATGLDAVAGIGAARKKALITHFGSANAAMGAGVADLAKVPGISPALAQKLYKAFHEVD